MPISSESIHLSNIRTLEGLLPPGYMTWGGAGGQNIEHPPALAILSSFFFFCFKCILVLLVRHSSGELSCPVTALIYMGVGKFFEAHGLGCISNQK